MTAAGRCKQLSPPRSRCSLTSVSTTVRGTCPPPPARAARCRLDRLLYPELAHHRFDSVPEGGQIKWFGNHQIDRRDFVGRRKRGQQDHWLVRCAILDGGGKFVPFHSWHGKIGKHQVELAGFETPQRFLAAARSFHAMAVVGQQKAD